MVSKTEVWILIPRVNGGQFFKFLRKKGVLGRYGIYADGVEAKVDVWLLESYEDCFFF